MGRHKVQLDAEQMQRIAQAIADPRRFEMLQMIAKSKSLSCSSVRECQPISAATISHHLKELGEAGLIAMEREGRTMDLSFRRDVWDAYLAQLANL